MVKASVNASAVAAATAGCNLIRRIANADNAAIIAPRIVQNLHGNCTYLSTGTCIHRKALGAVSKKATTHVSRARAPRITRLRASFSEGTRSLSYLPTWSDIAAKNSTQDEEGDSAERGGPENGVVGCIADVAESEVILISCAPHERHVDLDPMLLNDRRENIKGCESDPENGTR